MTTNITELAQSLKRRAASANEFGEGLFFIKADDVLALVEALASEKRICATWRKTANSTGEKLEKAQAINAAAEKLVRCKGRYHSEQNYRALAAL
ncbi:ead/Ea22-like family protein, partial [Klebsiella pneumoniae]